MRETTSTLLRKLREPESGKTYLEQIQGDLTLSHQLRSLMDGKGVTAMDWISAAGISKSYGYQILRGERIPGRDLLLRTALLLELSLEESQRLLAIGSCGALYPRIRRDAAVIFALNQHMTLLEAEELLASLPERSLYSQEG